MVLVLNLVPLSLLKKDMKHTTFGNEKSVPVMILSYSLSYRYNRDTAD